MRTGERVLIRQARVHPGVVGMHQQGSACACAWHACRGTGGRVYGVASTCFVHCLRQLVLNWPLSMRAYVHVCVCVGVLACL